MTAPAWGRFFRCFLRVASVPHILFPFPGILFWVMQMNFSDSKMEQYFNTLPPEVQNYILASGADISSLGELTLIGEHFRYSLGYEENRDL